MSRADNLAVPALVGAVLLAIGSILLVEFATVPPVTALIANLVAVLIVWHFRSTVRRMFRAQAGGRTSTAARRVTTVITERS